MMSEERIGNGRPRSWAGPSVLLWLLVAGSGKNRNISQRERSSLRSHEDARDTGVDGGAVDGRPVRIRHRRVRSSLLADRGPAQHARIVLDADVVRRAGD